MAAYLAACLEKADGDAASMAKALGDVARAKGMSQVALVKRGGPALSVRDGGRRQAAVPVSAKAKAETWGGERLGEIDVVLSVRCFQGVDQSPAHRRDWARLYRRAIRGARRARRV